jgi:putative endonuclease
MPYFVYILLCADGTYYTGIATDVERRVGEHNGMSKGKDKGARYTRARRPVSLAYAATFASRSEASKEEARIKSLSRAQKRVLIAAAKAQTA